MSKTLVLVSGSLYGAVEQATLYELLVRHFPGAEQVLSPLRGDLGFGTRDFSFGNMGTHLVLLPSEETPGLSKFVFTAVMDRARDLWGDFNKSSLRPQVH